jgi:hypothetical protein
MDASSPAGNFPMAQEDTRQDLLPSGLVWWPETRIFGRRDRLWTRDRAGPDSVFPSKITERVGELY